MGWTWKCSASWASVRSPLMAASATFALKAGVWFRRGRLFIVSPDSLAQRARCQAETPLIVLFRFLRPALTSFERRRAANCYAQLVTWYHGDISANPLYGCDFVRALKAIKARVLLLPGQTDLYFRVADNKLEMAHLAHAELTPIPSIWGHRAGNPASIPADAAFLKVAVRRWLE